MEQLRRLTQWNVAAVEPVAAGEVLKAEIR